MTPTLRRASPGMRRRTLLQAVLPALALGPFAARAANPVPIADMHSHYGMIFRGMRDSGLAEDMRAQRVALVAWSLPSDLGWIRAVPTGIVQAREPEPGTLAPAFLRTLARMRAYVAATGLKTVLTAADVDACIAGDAGIVLASEGTDFLEGRLESLDAFHAQGLRHVQLVHYIRNPIGDFQTTPPRHGGLSDLGKRLVEACNAKGMLVDLAHSPGPSIDQALAISKLPMVFSHGWVDRSEGSWRDAYGYLKRRLSLEQAKKIAARGGVVGLWGLALGNPGPSRTPGQGNWTVSQHDTVGYARELAHLVDWLGADHVALGTDIEGVGRNWSVNDYSQVRQVVEALQDMKLPGSVIDKVAYANYARVLKAALSGGR